MAWPFQLVTAASQAVPKLSGLEQESFIIFDESIVQPDCSAASALVSGCCWHVTVGVARGPS